MATAAQRLQSGVLVLLLLALVWRVAVALAMPVISRDGVTFCWYARSLEQSGLAHLRAESTHQHPLFPGLILGLKLLATTVGAPESPWLWQRCGQFISLTAGLAVVLLTASFAARLAERLDWGEPRRAAVAAGMLAAVLPLNVGLSADVMSDQLHLALYLGALLACLSSGMWAALGMGLLAGLAFLTRPEGAALVLAGAAAALANRRVPCGARLAQVALIGLGFTALAAPYWGVTGQFSAKKKLLDLVRQTSPSRAVVEHVSAELHSLPEGLASPASSGPAVAEPTVTRPNVAEPAMARLRLHDVESYDLPFWVTERTLHAGRYVVPLAAAAALFYRRRLLMRAALVGPATAFGLHTGLLLLLLHRYDYLDPRHALPLVALLIPFAALGLLSVPARWRAGAWLIVLMPLVIYSLRIPNGDQGHLRTAAAWLAEHDPDIRTKLLTGGNSQSRIAFYADMRWRYWLEDPTRWTEIRREFLAERPDYLALETGAEDHFERRGNAALLAALSADAELGPRLRELRRVPLEHVRGAQAPDPSTAAPVLWLYELDWR